MVRTLNERDISLLKKMAPEYSGESCPGSGVGFRSLLPPVANHFSSSAEDFINRINRLSPEDFSYLTELMLSGEESLHCLAPEYYHLLEDKIRAESGETIVRQIGSRYAMECD